MEFLLDGFRAVTWQQGVMYLVGFALIYLAIQKDYEPALLLPMGFGAILVNLPLSGAITQGDTVGPISALFEAGMSNELFPLLLFIGIGAMIDFGPLLYNPKLLLFGAASCVNIILFLSMDGGMHYLFFLFVLFLVIVVMMASYAFPLLSQFRNDSKSVIKNALIFSVAYLPRTALIVVINVFPWALLLTNLYMFLQGGFIWVVVYFAAADYINSRRLKKVFAPYMEPDEEEA